MAEWERGWWHRSIHYFCMLGSAVQIVHPSTHGSRELIFPQPWAAMEDGYYEPCACALSPLATVSMLIYVIVAFITMFNECKFKICIFFTFILVIGFLTHCLLSLLFIYDDYLWCHKTIGMWCVVHRITCTSINKYESKQALVWKTFK